VRAWHNTRGEPFGGPAAHAGIEIAWAEGAVAPEYVVSARRMTLEPSSAIVVPARAEHQTTIAPGGRAKVLVLNQAVVDEVADAIGVRPELQACVTTSPRFLRTCNLIFEEAVEKAAGHELVLDALTEALAVELLRTDASKTLEPPAPRPADLRIRRALAFIDASYADPLTLDAIAKVAGMSRFHFGRVFEAQVGKSPYRYLVDVRIERAAALLRSGRVSVTFAALSVGYNDLGRFGRAFRARFAVTPSEALAASRPKSLAPRTARLA